MVMKPQEPAEGISQQFSTPDFKCYRVDCSCGNPDDSIDFVVEVDDWQDIVVSHCTTQQTKWWEDNFDKRAAYNIKNEMLYNFVYYAKSFLNSLYHRMKVTWTVWTRGKVEYSSTVILTKQQALNYSEALRNAIIEVERNAEKIRSEKNQQT